MSERTHLTSTGTTSAHAAAPHEAVHVQPAATPMAAPAPFWTVERGLYALALLVAFGLRMLALGARPLSTWEASNSWPAWLAAQALTVPDAPAATGPLFYAWQWLLFWSGVNTDGGARFLSVVAGVAVVALPWWWRGWIGRRAALLLAFWWAVDPWLVAFSRLADGAAMGIAAGLLLMVATTQVAFGVRGVATWRKVLGTALGLTVVAGPMGWNLLVPCALLAYLLRDRLRENRVFAPATLAWAAGSALAFGTLLGARLDGLAWLASGASVWVSQFDGSDPGPLLPTIGGGYGLLWPWVRALVEAAAPVALGLAGFAVVWRRGSESTVARPLVYLAAGWVAWGLVLWLAPGRGPLALPVLGLPLTLLAAIWLDDVVAARPVQIDWREAGAVVLTVMILLTSGLFWLTAWLGPRFYDAAAAQAAAAIFGLTLAILVAFAVWSNRRDAGWIAAVLAAALLLVWTLRGGWRLNYGDALSEPAGWQADVAHPELRILVDDVATLSAHRTGDHYQIPVQVQVAARPEAGGRVVPARPDPVVGWQLRNMRDLTWVTSPNVAEDAGVKPLVITAGADGAETDAVVLPGGYGGSVYHIEAHWLPENLIPVDAAPVGEDGQWGQAVTERVRPWWRWLIYREAPASPAARDVVLWAPLD